MPGRRRVCIFVAVALLAPSARALAGQFSWDASGTHPAGPVDGSGAWDASTAHWSNGATDSVWNNSGGDTAVFGVGQVAGTVDVDPNGVTAAGLTFHSVAGSAGYVLDFGPIFLTPGNDLISTTNSGVSPEISSVLAGSDGTRNVTFSGAIALAAPANSYVGATMVTQTNVAIGGGGNLDYAAPFGAAGNALTLDGSILTANGSRTGASVSYQLPYNITIKNNNTIFTGKSFTLGASSSTLYTVSGDGSLIFNNNISATTSNVSASFSGTGANAFTGTLHLNSIGANTIKLFPTSSGNFLGVPNGTLDVNASVAPQTIGAPFTFTLGALTGSSSGTLGGGLTPATIATYSVGGLGLSTTYSGSITGNAALTLTGGSLKLAGTTYSYTGPTNVAGGTLILAASLTQSASVSVAGGATLAMSPSGSHSIATPSLAVNAKAVLDVGDNSLTVSYSGASPVAMIRSLLVSGFLAGNWDGKGIDSSVAHADASSLTGLGYIDNGTSVVVKYVRYGDNNLDGVVNTVDFQMFLDGIAGVNGSSWAQGDYIYDGTVDIGNDFNLFLVNYLASGGSLGQLAPIVLGDGDLSGAQKGMLLALVPEPGGITLLSLGAWVAVTKRQRRRDRGCKLCDRMTAETAYLPFVQWFS
jgi:hypothetical protein